MKNNHNTIHVKKENNRVENVNIAFNILRIYATLYHTYKILYGKDKFMWKKRTIK